MAGLTRRKTIILGAILLLGLVLASGCGHKPDKSENPFFDKWRAMAEKSKGFTPARTNVNKKAVTHTGAAKARQIVGGQKDRPLPKRRITVKLRELDVSMVLRAVARAVGQNIMINEAISGKITLNVKNVPWDQVFTGILRTQGLDYAWEGDIIRVMTAEEKIREMQRDILTVIVPIDYADAEELQTNLQAILSSEAKKEGEKAAGEEAAAARAQMAGSVLVDKHNNALIIQASREEIQRILPVIETLDQPSKQVLIQAHIVEATKDTARELGIQWGGLYNNGNQWFYPGVDTTAGNTAGTAAPTAGYVSNPYGSSVNTGGGFGNTGLTAAGFSLGYMVGDIGANILAAQLNALQQDGQVNILSSPSITTLDNLPAIIESGREVPYQTVSEGEVSIEWKTASLSLEVTPYVIEGDTLKLKILTKKDELDFANAVSGNPTVRTKRAETNVIVADGQTTVIGGLNIEEERKTNTGIPGLKDIPIIGWMFGADAKAKTMEELLIFITPYVLKERAAGGK